MSKTYRRGEWRTTDRERWDDRSSGGVVCSSEPMNVTREWADKRIADHLAWSVTQLVKDGWIAAADYQYFFEMIREVVLDAAVGFDPEYRTADGDSCSPSHYCLMLVDRKVANVIREVEIYRKYIKEVPISYLPEDDAEKHGFVSEEVISDGCRTINELFFRMDVMTLRGMLTPTELAVFELRMIEMTMQEIGDRLAVSRWVVMRVLRRIQKKCIECGFGPRTTSLLRSRA